MNNQLMKLPNRGAEAPQTALAVRDNFAGGEMVRSGETQSQALAAREQALVNARFIMAERHPRDWDTVRVRVLSHCDRPGFATVARYKKPAGKKEINGQWVNVYAEGLSARFAEVARQEMGNTSTETMVAYEDDLVRVVRCVVTDLERNNVEAREITIAKVVEKRGKKVKGTDRWDPPDGREVISVRTNTYGEPVFLVKATDDEVRIKQNSEVSKTTRDCSLRLIPKDIRDDAEERILKTLEDPGKVDPAAQRKKICDSFAKIGVLPDDLVTYMAGPLDRLSPAQLDELRGLYTAISDGETTFAAAMKQKYDVAPGEEESRSEHDARLERQMQEQKTAAEKAEEVAKQKIAALKATAPAAATEEPKPAAEPPKEEAPDQPEQQTLTGEPAAKPHRGAMTLPPRGNSR